MIDVTDGHGRAVLVIDRSVLTADVIARGLATYGFSAMPRPRSAVVAALEAEVVVLDIDNVATDLDGLIAEHAGGSARVVTLSRSRSERGERRAREAGAVAHLTRSQSLDELAYAVGCVARGEKPPATAAESTPCVLDLTTREREVLVLIACGMSNDAIANELTLSPNTIRTHVQNLLGKLGVEDRLAAAALARRDGLVTSSGSGSAS